MVHRIAARLRATAIAILLSCAVARGRAPAAEIPEAIHQAYLQGAKTIIWPADPARVPLTGTDWFGHYRSPYVTVFLNGRGPFTFLFDTGASVTILSTKAVRAAGVQIISQVPGHHAIVRAGELRVAGISMRNYYAVIGDGDDVDGILGFNAFGTSYLEFDFATSTLVVSKRPVPLPNAFWLPYTLIARIPNVDLSIAGQMLPTLVDTGDDAYAWEATAKDVKGLTFVHPPMPAATVVNGETGVTQTAITTVNGTLNLGPMLSRQPAIGINDALPVPDIGMPVIDQFNVEFDRVAQRVAFQPRFRGNEFQVPGLLTPGFSVTFGDDKRLVRFVTPNMQPAQLGMRTGDVIDTINGRPASEISYRTWDALLETHRPIAIAWKDAGTAKSATFTVIELR